MTEIGQKWLSWKLNEDGSGTATLSVERGPHVAEREYKFDSLDELPEDLASRIREDGRRKGKVTWLPGEETADSSE